MPFTSMYLSWKPPGVLGKRVWAPAANTNCRVSTTSNAAGGQARKRSLFETGLPHCRSSIDVIIIVLKAFPKRASQQLRFRGEKIDDIGRSGRRICGLLPEKGRVEPGYCRRSLLLQSRPASGTNSRSPVAGSGTAVTVILPEAKS